LKEFKKQTSFTIYESISDLPVDDRDLLQKAKKAVDKAYAPYSHFQVGAALLLENDKIVIGNNQENAAYPSGMCAERVAIWSAASHYPGIVVKKVAIAVKSQTKIIDKPVAPCGACRQSLLEYEIKQKEPIEVFFMGEIGKVIKANSLQDLLPFSFDQSYL